MKENGAITDEDIEKYNRARVFRNGITHEMENILFHGVPSNLPDLYHEMIFLADKIEKWWIMNVDIPTNIDLIENGISTDIDEKEVIPGLSVHLT